MSLKQAERCLLEAQLALHGRDEEALEWAIKWAVKGLGALFDEKRKRESAADPLIAMLSEKA